MGFFDDLKEKVTQSSQTVYNKAKDMGEIVSIKAQISSEQKTITSVYQQIGEQYFAKNSENEADEFAALMAQIKAANEKIAGYNNELLKLRNVRLCPTCGAECEMTVNFCASCGNKLPVVEVEVKENVPSLGKKFCVSCKGEIDEDANFCVLCGSKQEEPQTEETVSEVQSEDNAE